MKKIALDLDGVVFDTESLYRVLIIIKAIILLIIQKEIFIRDTLGVKKLVINFMINML